MARKRKIISKTQTPPLFSYQYILLLRLCKKTKTAKESRKTPENSKSIQGILHFDPIFGEKNASFKEKKEISININLLKSSPINK